MYISNESLLCAFGLTLFAGLATGIGSAIAFFAKRTNTRLLCAALGFSAGVMIYVSFVEIFAKAQSVLCAELGNRNGQWVAFASFLGGIFLITIIDKCVPSFENPHEAHKVEELHSHKKHSDSHLLRMGLLSALVIGIHNFPEGLATFTASLKDLSLGIPIAIAIAIHNIPEGIAVSVPIYYATGNRKKAFILSFLSGLSEPCGALAGYLFLFSILSETVFGIIFAVIAGIMVFISLDQLLPTAEKYGEHHIAIYGLIGGMIVMGLSLILLV